MVLVGGEGMDELLERIAQAREYEIADVLTAVLRRYGELFPDWEICTIAVNKNEDKVEQIDCIIDMLEKMKTLH